MSAPTPTIADLLASMTPEKRERCEFLIFELIRTLAPEVVLKQGKRARAKPEPVVTMPAGASEADVWICDLAYRLSATHPEMTLAEIRGAIANSGVTLSRADLVGVLDPVKVERSRVESRYAHRGEAHYVVVIR